MNNLKLFSEFSKRKKFILAVVLQLVIIFFIIGLNVKVIREGKEILLSIQPVDPKDPFRGDYIEFQYDISFIDRNIFKGELPKAGQRVYVSLRKNKDRWVIESAQKNKPDNNKVFLKGKVIRSGMDEFDNNNNGIRVNYGIENYFVAEGEGVDLRDERDDVYAKIKVDKDGKGILEQVYVNNKPWP